MSAVSQRLLHEARPDEIAVTGATGTVGAAVVAELASLGHHPRALVRPGSTARPPTRSTRVAVDLDDPAALRSALSGVRALLLLTPLRPRQDLLHESLLNAALDAGVERGVKLSALGADPESAVRIHSEHGRSDRAVRESGLSYAILRPNAFMQNVMQWRGMVARNGTIELPMGDARISMIDARDIAAVAVRALLDWDGVRGAYDLTGPQALSYDDIAEHLSAASGRKVRYVDVAPTVSADNMRAAGTPAWAIEARLGLYSTIRAGEAQLLTSTVQRITGRSPCYFADFAAEVSAAFQPVG
ncbi:NmrA family NAD(P)-binding protein [Salinactinospora qingdaonensis]|uniref:SDR family oxidoreductase n=1 Tax=Salinactinospora qingdaonensis TaxID=702744 RepID=A0ABP7GIL3_9ACTN